jgi:hypothetical protein
VLLLSSRAHAQAEDEKQACVAAFDAAQQHRAEQRLLKAREALLQCGQPSCPDVVRTKCMEWLPELERALPSIVVAVKDRRGEDTVVADVHIDGSLVARRIDGRPIVIDPGPHTIRIELKGSPPQSKRIVAQQGDKLRKIAVSFAPPEKEKPSPTDAQIAALAKLTLPETLPYEEGDEIPPGYERDSRIRTGLVVSGGVTFTVAWLVSIFVAAGIGTQEVETSTGLEQSRGNRALYVPVVGPFVAIGTLHEPGAAGIFTLVVDGVTQSAGVAMIFAGLFAREQLLVRQKKTEQKKIELMPLPGGVTLRGAF